MAIHYAYCFFNYSKELHQYCKSNLIDKIASTHTSVSDIADPNMIRVSLADLSYTTCKALHMHTQRERLSDDTFYALMLCPTEEARQELIRDAYKNKS